MKKEFDFRKAKESDLLRLRTLAEHSEAHWGFDDYFIKTFNEKYNLTVEFMKSNPVFIMNLEDEILGFWGIFQSNECAELEFFYIDVKHLKEGLGKHMWVHMISWCENQGIKKIEFVTSQQAVGFYEKCGAVQDGKSISTIDGREIPHLSFEIMV